MNLLSVTDAAKLKGVSRQALIDAIKRGDISASKVGNQWIVEGDATFEQWEARAYPRQAKGDNS